MKRTMLILSILAGLALAATAMASQAVKKGQKPVPPVFSQVKQQPEGGQIQKAIVEFTEPVKLMGTLLRGDYLFLHDEGKMARGEACTWIYQRGPSGKFDKLVASFHCIPVDRKEPADRFKLLVSAPDPATGLSELLEYRFSGSTEGHKVPQSTE